MKSLLNFSDSALTRSEMKRVTGGCYVNNGSGGYYVQGSSAAKKAAKSAGTNYCCQSCYTTEWCYDPD